MRIGIAFASFAALGATFAPADPIGGDCDPGIIRVEAEPGRVVSFDVEIARTPDEKAQGLMFRPSLAPDRGMIFVYDPAEVAGFWMKNTMISLDMIFIGADGRVLNLAERTVPYSLETHRSEGPVRIVLEIAGGRAAALGIDAGDRAVHPEFDAAPEGYRCDP
ncbi:MAG: DUF192 domain-containing protein [Paracoccaceae bacterium]